MDGSALVVEQVWGGLTSQGGTHKFGGGWVYGNVQKYLIQVLQQDHLDN